MLAHVYVETVPAVVPVRPALSAAVTWRIFTELFRRHRPGLELAIQDTSQASTQERLTLVCHIQGRELALGEFDVFARMFQPLATLGRPRLILNAARWPNRSDYVAAYLAADDPKVVIDQIEAIVGLPDRHAMSLAPSDQATLSARLIAALMQRYSMSRMRLSIRCGATGTWPAIQTNPALSEFHHMPHAPEAAALQYVVTTTSPNKLETRHGVLSLHAQVWPWKHSAYPLDLFDAWRHHHSIDELCTAVQRLIDLPEA